MATEEERDSGAPPGCEAKLFDARSAGRLVPAGELEPAWRFFDGNGPLILAAVAVRFARFTRPVLRKNADNYGLYIFDPARPAPFFWFGLAWSVDDPPERLPSWGASFEVNGERVARFDAGEGGLLAACERAVGAREGVGPTLHRFAEHVELASWRPFSWLLEQDDQRRALERFWFDYLDALVDAGLPEAVAAFGHERR